MALYRFGGGGAEGIAVSEGVLYDNLILSTWGDYVTVHRKEIYQLTYRALALRQSNEMIRSDEGLTLETSALETFYVGQFTL